MRTSCIAQGTGKEIQGRGYIHTHTHTHTHTDTWLIHFAVQQKLAQHCKATVLQFKKKIIYIYIGIMTNQVVLEL